MGSLTLVNFWLRWLGPKKITVKHVDMYAHLEHVKPFQGREPMGDVCEDDDDEHGSEDEDGPVEEHHAEHITNTTKASNHMTTTKATTTAHANSQAIS
ncbi:MAG: hypothetical protein ACKPKO_53630, partial [Candidatus Fonsibacter sp.]